MDRKIQSIAEKKLKAKRKRKIWQKIVAVATCGIVFCTTYALILPAITMEHDDVYCGIEAHQHAESCYSNELSLICEKEGQVEASGHQHAGDCYAMQPVLVCENASEEHQHDETCFEESEVLVCGLEETEDIIHTHSDSCYIAEDVLTCQISEHTHSLICFSNPAADLESDSVWERSVADVSLTGVWGDDIVAVAKTQLGYTESTRNYFVDENEQIHGYTRYGAWYGDLYGDWSAMFASFCIHYADVPQSEMPVSAQCHEWISSLSALGLWINREGTPNPGDLIFFDKSQDGRSDHVGIIEYVEGSTIHTIEGDQDNAVVRMQYPAESASIMGFGAVPENPDYVAPLDSDELLDSDEGEIEAEATEPAVYSFGVSEDESAVPLSDDTELSITLDETLNVEVEGKNTVKIPFTPEFTHQYVWRSTGSGDTYGRLYDASGTQITYDNNGGGSSQFKISYTLTGGTLYYLGVEWYSSSKSGTIPVLLSLGEHSYTQNESGDYVCGCGEIAVKEGTCGTDGNITWSFDNGVLTISGSGDMPNDSSGLPWLIFKDIITSVVIEDGVTSIGSDAFGNCANLVSVTIPNSVTSIGSKAFQYCRSLASVEISDSTTNIGDYAFYFCTSLSSVDIPNGVTSIGNYTFAGCSGLSSVEIPNSVASIGNSAFNGCYSLTSVEIPDGVTDIGDSAFYRCSSLTSVKIPNGVTSIKSNVFQYCSSLASVEIPDSVTSIGSSTFAGCSNLTSVEISNNVISIGSSAFDGCTKLTSVDIPDGVTSIGNSAFYGCSSLTSVEIPETVSYIGGRAFLNCKGLRNLSLNCDLNALSTTAFAGCSISTITLDNRSLSCGDIAKLSQFASVPEVVIGTNVDEISAEILNAFDGSEIYFVGENTFNLSGDAVVGRTPLPAGRYYVDEDGALYRLESGQAILTYCPPGVRSYTVPTAITVDGTAYTVAGVGDYAISNASSLTALTFDSPENILSVGYTALGDCITLSSINGETTWQSAAALFVNANPPATDITFFRTQLWNNGVTVITDPTDTVTDDNRNVKLEITTYDTLMTGEYARANLQIDKGDLDSGTYIRLYFYINGDNYTVPYQLGELQFSAGNGSYVTGRFCSTDHPDVFYLEMDPLKAGDTLDLNIAYRYDNVVSAGGDIFLDLKLLSQEERNALGTSVPAISGSYKTTWVTEENPYTLNETHNYYKYGLLYGDGTADGDLSVRQLQYQTTLKLESDLFAYGTDNLFSVDFTQTLEMPEGFSWKEGLLEAVENGNYRYSSGYFYVTIDGTEYQIVSLSTDSSFSNYSLSVNEEGKLQIHYTYKNPDPSKEPSIPTMNVSYNNAGVIIADKNQIDEDISNAGTSVTYEFANKVDAVLHYTYGEDAALQTSYQIPVTVGAADYTLSKTSSGSGYLGADRPFTISLKNTNNGTLSYPLPCTGFDYVNDPMPYWFYIKPENMQLMFEEEYGKDLSITIASATLCTPVSHTVTGTDGREYEINQQYEGDETPHQGKTSVDNSVIREDATIVIAWNESKSHLVLTVDGGSPITIGEGMDYPTIGDALDGIGYVVTKNASYTTKWNMQELTLYSGQTVDLQIYATSKTTFMLLEGDQDWYLQSSTILDSTTNYAYAFKQDGSYKRCQTSSYLYRDFTLYKNAYKDGQLLNDDEGIEPGDIITYTNSVTRASNSTNIAVLPLVDHMSGSQILLVTAADNPSLSGLGLETITDDSGVLYYILDRPGTYESIVVGSTLADRVVITASQDGNPDTEIYWYLTPAATKAVSYQALVRDKNNAALFSLANEVWLGDHASHRLYDQTYKDGSLAQMNKFIVSENGDDNVSSNDTLVSRSTVQSGGTVNYRLMVAGSGSSTVTVPGSAMYDILPAGVDSFNWDADKVSVRYVAEPGSTITIHSGDETYVYDGDNPLVLEDLGGSTWFITDTRPGAEAPSDNQRYLCWNADFSITISGKLYVYVTLVFPEGDAWSDYVHAYGSSQIQNTFYVYHLSTAVTHDLAVTAEAWLQKGVYDSGLVMTRSSNRFYYTSNLDANGRTTYVNQSLIYGYVRYYVTVCNTGESRLYLSEIQDVLPQGFTFQTMNTTYWTGSNKTSGSTMTSGFTKPQNVTLKSASVTASTENLENGYQRVTFNLTTSSTSTTALNYDETLGRYYLNPNEAVAFYYFCNTNGREDTADVANNTAAMKFYDYNGAGLSVSEASGITPSDNASALPNDGTCEVMSNAQAELIGMTGGDTETQWLASNVTVVRGKIAPGIVKENTKDFATTTEELPWKVTVSNSGTLNMYDYTLSDMMMAPYQHEGLVSYELTYRTGAVESGSAWRIASSDLFTIGERTPGDSSVSITSNGTTKTLTVNGDPVELNAKLSYYNGSYTTWSTATIYVSIVRDADSGQETLVIRLADDKLAISPGGTGVLTLQTKNYSILQENKSFINVCYVTPSQEFDQGDIIRGQYEFYNGQDSVESEAQVPVSFGYATTALKQVEELDTGTTNSAKSNEAQNYIVLQNNSHKFRYTLSVSNTGGDTEAVSIEKLVVIDNLPEPGDHTTCYDEFKRYSDFRVDFADDPNVTVTVNGMPLTADQYSVEFSDGTSFGSDDWQPNGNPDAWYSEPRETSRSLRVVILDDTKTVMPGNALISISFDAQIPEDVNVSSGQVAWNSFGYQYRLSERTLDLQSAPDKVGIRIAGTPNLTKLLQDVNENTYSAEEDTTFRFLIVQGSGGISLDTAGNPTGLDGKTFTYVTVTVPADQSQSTSIPLQGLHVYEYADGNYTETETSWVWNHGTKYTIIELPTEDYAFDNINGMSKNSYTFSYNNSLNQGLNCTNIFKTWSIQVIKQDSETKEYLSGAVFGLYSPNADDQMTEEEFNALKRTLGNELEWTAASVLSHGDSTWYLTGLQMTESTGTVRFDELRTESYLLKELKAPDGYNLSTEIFSAIRPDSGMGTVTISVPNTQGYALPESGGRGVFLYTLGGMLLMLSAGILLFIQKKKNRRKGDYHLS